MFDSYYYCLVKMCWALALVGTEFLRLSSVGIELHVKEVTNNWINQYTVDYLLMGYQQKKEGEH